jgi:hypothetical protein
MLEVAHHRIAARPQRQGSKVPQGFGLEGLLKSWMLESTESPKPSSRRPSNSDVRQSWLFTDPNP